MDTRGPSATPLLAASALTRHLPGRRGKARAPAVDNLSLTLHAGDVLGLLGLNGAGKSTTLRLLSGCLTPHAGSVHIAGHHLQDEPLAARAALGYLADTPALYDDLRVSDQLTLAARLRRVPRDKIGAAVSSAIEACALTEVARRRCGTLSKGYRQRVGIAQAIVHEPRVLLLDEPSSGLDPQQLDDMRQLVRRLGEQRCVVLSSHLLGEVQACCTRIAVLHRGALRIDRSLQAADDGGESLAALFARLVSDEVSDESGDGEAA